MQQALPNSDASIVGQILDVLAGHRKRGDVRLELTLRPRAFIVSMRVNTEDRERAEKIIQYKFKNAELLKESLTHASVADHRLKATSGWNSSATPCST